MKFLIDKSPKDVKRKADLHPEFVGGQLLTPLTRYSNAGGAFAIENGLFKGLRFDAYKTLLAREKPNRDRCLFVTCFDVVGSGRRTLEIWRNRYSVVPEWHDWPLALVAQDGMEDLDIPWGELDAIFIGGLDPWKDSSTAIDLVKTAKILGKHAHVGRVNTPKRYERFAAVGADTCDGSGVSMYDHMLDTISVAVNKEPEPTLFDKEPVA